MSSSVAPKTLHHLMFNLCQPTDAVVGSIPLLWRYHARDFQHLALVLMWINTPPPGYESIRSPSFAVTRRVAVAELSTTNTETIPCTPEEIYAPPVVTDSHPVPVVVSTPAEDTCPLVPMLEAVKVSVPVVSTLAAVKESHRSQTRTAVVMCP